MPPLLLILVLTLVPDPGAGEEPPLLCLVCDRRALADALLNVALFLPLGSALAVARVGWRATLLAAAALTLAIESAQVWVPGRVTSSADLLSNAAGVALGWLLLRRGGALVATPARRTALSWASAAVPALAVALTGALLSRALPGGRWIAEWAPTQPGQPAWDGTLSGVFVGGAPVPPGPLGDHSAELAARLAADQPLTLEGTAGSISAAGLPVFRIVDDAGREVVLVGARGVAVYARLRTRGAALLLDSPELRLDGALHAAPTGGPLDLELRPTGRRFCLRVNSAGSCRLRYTAGDGWRLLLNPPGLPSRTRTVLGAVWLFAVAAPAGLLAPRSARAALLRAALVAAGVAAALLAVDTIVLTWLDAAALGAGFTVGWMLRHAWRAGRAAAGAPEARAAAV